MDREKVIKALECCLNENVCPSNKCVDCPYRETDIEESCIDKLQQDSLSLLKEQEAVEPKTGHWIWLQFCANEGVYCSECHTKMFDRYPMKKKLSQFCGHCGAKMDDEVEGR